MLQDQSVWPGLGGEMIKGRGCQFLPASSEAASSGVPASGEGAFPPSWQRFLRTQAASAGQPWPRQAGRRVNWITVPVWHIRFTELWLASGSCCKDLLSVAAPCTAPRSPVTPVAGGHGPASMRLVPNFRSIQKFTYFCCSAWRTLEVF